MVIVHTGNLMQSTAEYICHQVNCRGVMGSGIAKQIKEKYPEVFHSYYELCRSSSPEELLGTAQIVKVSPRQCVVNLFGQDKFGRSGGPFTDLHALREACDKVAKAAGETSIVAMPYRIGCGLGGGDWGAVMDMLVDVFSRNTVILYKL